VVGSNLKEDDVEAQVSADEERKSHRYCWLFCDCRIGVIVADIITIILLNIGLVATVVISGNDETVKDDGSFINYDDNGTILYNFGVISSGMLRWLDFLLLDFRICLYDFWSCRRTQVQLAYSVFKVSLSFAPAIVRPLLSSR
jgi:hypothetical protein